MLFCQFAKSHSVHVISNGLCSATDNLNHLPTAHPCFSLIKLTFKIYLSAVLFVVQFVPPSLVLWTIPFG